MYGTADRQTARGEIDWHLPPLAAGLHDVQHRVHNPVQLILARPPSTMPIAPHPLQQRLQLQPLRVRQIARIHASKL